jgi:tryptophan halogenase
VGESTIPPIRTFHRLLNIDEQEFMRATAATFKLGISFEDWKRPGERYIHSFGMNGKPTWVCEFHHFWLHSLTRGIRSELGDYCLELQAARREKFATSASRISTTRITWMPRFTRSSCASSPRAMVRSVSRGRSGTSDRMPIPASSRRSCSIRARSVEGDLFIDCTGFRGVLIEQALHTKYQDWTHWLPCDSAVAVQTESVGPAVPYTRAIAHEAGWRWRIPLQHRVGNGLVYCSPLHVRSAGHGEAARGSARQDADQPRVIKFNAGRRLKAWNKNVVALGLASGFLEPLESTSIHLIMTGISRLMRLFPFNGVVQSFVDQYNEEVLRELEAIRDFLVLHYHAVERDDSPFWNHCRRMFIPASLARRIEMFQKAAHAWQYEGELFASIPGRR